MERKKTGNEWVREKDIEAFSAYSSKRRWIDIRISNGELSMEVCDYGPECEIISGRDEYEFTYSLDEKDTAKLMNHLRKKYDAKMSGEEILRAEFGKDSGSVDFRRLCGRLRIEPMFWSY